MKLFSRGFIILIFFLLLFSLGSKAYALQTPEIFATGTSVSQWDTSSNLFGPPDSIYATKTTGTLAGYWYFSDSLNIPLSATIKSLVFNIYAQSSGNSSGTNGWSVYLNGVSCSSFPDISLGNGVRTVTINEANCTGSNDFTDVVQANKGVLNMPSPHVIGYSRNSGSGRTYIWDSVGVYATYELPDPVLTPTPPSVDPPPGSVWEWIDAESLAVQKEGLTDIVDAAIGGGHNLALKKDGTVYAWGSNNYGQLGIGTTSTAIIDPVQVKDSEGYLTGIKAIAAGSSYSIALKKDGTVWTWGINEYDARGTGIGDNNDSNNKLLTATQVLISNGFLQIVAIAAGDNHSIALKSDGSVFTWGRNDQGQTGTGYSIYSSIVRNPTKVAINNIVSIAAGSMHSLVAKDDGTVWGWGRLDSGQLGTVTNGWASDVGLPVQIPGINSIKSVYAGDNMSMAISEDDKIFEWGSGRDYPDRNPRQVPDLENISVITGRGSTGAAIKEDGTVWTFNTNYLFARPVPGLWNISSISVGRYAPNLAVVKMTEETPTPTLTPTPTPTPTPKTPLILIPGIGGSEFKVNESFSSAIKGCGISPVTFNYNAGDLVWIDPVRAGVSPCDEYLDVLKLKTDGVTPEYPQIGLSGNIFEDAYKNTVKFFTDNGYELNKTLFLFPYDWRLNIADTLTPLGNLINQIKTQTGSQRVDIVAHSMGGLVARNYISDSSKAQNVRKLFTLGTPHLGSVEFLKNLRFGGCLTIPALEDWPICLGIAPLEVKDLLQNMISGYTLAPSKEYFNFYNGQDKNHLYPYVNNGQMLDYNQIKSFLTGLNYNTSLFSPSELFHALDNQLINTNGVEITNIAGSGLATLGQIREKSAKDFFGNTVKKKDGFSTNGDETVPLFSASLIDTGSNKSLLGNAKVYYTKQEHGELVASGSALNLVKNILKGNSYLPDGISVFPYPFSGTELSVHSPVNIDVYDNNNNHTGPTSDGNFEANIPGSSYDTLDDAKFIFIPGDGNYTIKFDATGQGSFDFKIRKYEDDSVAEEILYKDIPLTTLTKAEAQLDTSSDVPPIVHLDEDGNGTIDQDINSSSSLMGDAIFDQVPPQTAIILNGTKGNNGWYKSNVEIILQAQDEASGSGVLKTEYSLDGGATVNIYTQPFIISSEKINKLKFRSVDNAGNEEDPKEMEIKIDKTAPEAKIFIDPDKQDLIVKGIDVNSTIIIKSENKLTRKKDDAFYLITDEAGNTLKIDVRERDKSKQDRFRIYSVQYNNDAMKTLASNYFNVTYNGKRQRANVKEQNFELKGEVRIRIRYDAKKNKSTIIIKENKKERVKEIKNGLILLQLLTDRAKILPAY